MTELWFYAWLLVGAGFQVSEPYTTQAECAIMQHMTAATMLSPDGRPIEKVYLCQRGAGA